MSLIEQQDPELFKAMQLETARQRDNLELIASENYCSRAVMEAAGSVLTNKYAEGYPGKRYYGGCEFVDMAENLARDRAKALFGADHANVQPHSGSQANMGVYFSIIKPGDTILGMNLSHGGHLTHGSPVSFSGRLYNIVSYGVDKETEMIDYEELSRKAHETKPKVIVAGASAYSRTIDFARFRAVADEVGALLMVDMAHIAGLVAAGLHPSPIKLAHFTTTVSFSGRLYNIVSYGVDKETEMIDYEELSRKAHETKPKVIVAGASAYSRTIDFARFRAVADEVGALLMVDMAHIAGLVAAGLHPSPIKLAHFTTTTTHKTLRGPRGGMIFVGKDGENTIGVLSPKGDKPKLWSEVLDSSVMPGIQGGPLMHVIAAKAVALKEAQSPGFKVYMGNVVKNAAALAGALKAGGGRIVSGGTDNHLMLVDLGGLDITGKEAETWLDQANITVNKNGIPFDQKSPFVTSGIRVGTPALTTRGMSVPEMEEVAGLMMEVLKSKGDSKVVAAVKARVLKLTARFPLP